MDKFFNSAYRGDPGVPHSGPDRFVNVWVGSVAYSVLSHFYPYMWQLTNQHNWHDRPMVYEQYHWKKAVARSNLTISGGTRWIRRSKNHTTTTGRSTSHRY